MPAAQPTTAGHPASARHTDGARRPAPTDHEVPALERLLRLAGAAVDAHARRVAIEREAAPPADLEAGLDARRRLFGDLVRCLLLRGVPPARVTGLLEEVVAAAEAPLPPTDPVAAAGHADRRLVAAIEVAFAHQRPSPAVAEMLGLHYLRLTGGRRPCPRTVAVDPPRPGRIRAVGLMGEGRIGLRPS